MRVPPPCKQHPPNSSCLPPTPTNPQGTPHLPPKPLRPPRQNTQGLPHICLPPDPQGSQRWAPPNPVGTQHLPPPVPKTPQSPSIDPPTLDPPPILKNPHICPPQPLGFPPIPSTPESPIPQESPQRTPVPIPVTHLASLGTKGGSAEGGPGRGCPPSRPQQPQAGGGQRTGGQCEGTLPPPPPRPPHRASYGERVGAEGPAGGTQMDKGGGGVCQGGTCPTPPNPAPAAHPKPLPRENEAPQFSGGGKWVTQGTNWSMGVSCGGAETPSDPRQIGEGGQTGPWGGERRGIRHLGGV